MLLDALTFEQVWTRVRGQNAVSRSVAAFFELLERRFGARFFYDASHSPLGPDCADLSHMAGTLQKYGVIKKVFQTPSLPDEPPIIQWNVECNTTIPHTTGGISFKDKRAALTAALAESLERYIWYETSDYFESTQINPAASLKKKTVLPSHFVGFSEHQRKTHVKLGLKDSDIYMWTTGYSWISKNRVWLPAQVVSAFEARRRGVAGEPLIRPSITTGLATWTTREGAVLRGALEIIERDAFMITWFNQLSLPVIAWNDVRKSDASLDALLSTCEQYRLNVYLIRLITDAPAHVACVVVKDDTKEGPPITLGLKAHASLARAAEGALLEALRARLNLRRRRGARAIDQSIKPSTITHNQRTLYWSEGKRHEKLSFLISGKVVQPPKKSAWESDTEEGHLQRTIGWCRDKGYELVSVDMCRSKKNPLPWNIEMVVIPQLQPMHQNEKHQCVGGARIKEIPGQFGFAPRPKPFTEEPHPFA